jgi:hypothetical protein
VGEAWQLWTLLLVYGLYHGLTEGAEKALGVYHAGVGLAALPASLIFGVFWSVLGPELAFGIGAGLAGLASVLMVGLISIARPAARPA